MAAGTADAARRELGLDPTRLRILEFQVLSTQQRDILEGKFGFKVLEETSTKEPRERTDYEVNVTFENAQARRRFIDGECWTSLGASWRPAQVTKGDSPLRGTLVFADKGAAEAFGEDTDEQGLLQVVQVSKTSSHKADSLHCYLVHAGKGVAWDHFLTELQLWPADQSRGPCLNASERTALFLSLDAVRHRGPESRVGPRLARHGVPEGGDLVLDADLFHPGDSEVKSEVERDFLGIVRRYGGTATGPSAIGDCLLVSRVRGSAELLRALLEFDWVSEIDLPPTVVLSHPTVSPDDLPDSSVLATADLPLVCVVDSGVAPAHPLLDGLVAASFDFNGEEADEFDHCGHGTAVAGIAVYGDVQECLDKRRWEPRVRVVSAKVTRRADTRTVRSAVFSSAETVPEQLQRAVEEVVAVFPECRVFVIAIGDMDNPYLGGRQKKWATTLDVLAREHDIVIVVPVGNSEVPSPSGATRDAVQATLRDRLADPSADAPAVLDPGSALNALTVSGITRADEPEVRDGRPHGLVASPRFGPSAFNRVWRPAGRRAGLAGAVKPDLCSYAGNAEYRDTFAKWFQPPCLGEPVLHYEHAAGRLIAHDIGTSYAAPYAAHVAARTMHELRTADGAQPSANLCRALVVNAAVVPGETRRWLEGGTAASDLDRTLRCVGHGLPDPDRSCFSTESRTVLYFDGRAGLAEGEFDMFEIALPEDFALRTGTRTATFTLAYDPPVRAQRQEYLLRTMWVQAYANKLPEELARQIEANVKVKALEFAPAPEHFHWSTCQSYRFVRKTGHNDVRHPDTLDPAVWHVVVGCQQRLDLGQEPRQRYALVVSLEHSDDKVRLYQQARALLQQRARQRG